MLICIISSVFQDDNCRNTSFQQPYETQKGRQVAKLTETGFTNYINRNIDLAIIYLQQAQIPDIDISVSTFKFQLKNLQIVDAQFPYVHVDLSQLDQSAQFQLIGVNMTIHFDFSIKEQVWPYVSDTGNGSIYLINAQIAGKLFGSTDSNCLGALNLSAQDFSLLISQLQINLDSQYSYIYESILQLLTNSLIDLFNNEMQEPLQEAILEVANYGVQGSELYAFCNGEDNAPVTDQRTLNISVYDQYFDTYSVGIMCYLQNNSCYGQMELEDNYPSMPKGCTNSDVQYYLSSDLIQSMLNLINQQNYDQYQISQKPCQNAKFVNTGIAFTCQYEDGSIEYQASIITDVRNINTQLQLTVFQVSNLTIVNYDVQLEDNIEQYKQSLQNALDMSQPGYDNGNYVNAQSCYSKQWIEQWMSVSCNFDGSITQQ